MRNISARHAEQKAKVMAFLKEYLADIHVPISVDLWSKLKRGFININVHVRKGGELVPVAVAFNRMHYPHTAERLADEIVNSLVEMGIDIKDKSWTMIRQCPGKRQAYIGYADSS
eukprot:GHVU01122909.1.p1 GENE.GHVU01122909.1~~GHVU01122909.1.p1  ORF type:complete len:115 (-),score=9.45 GHVU01122909.1:93-437(-)